MVCRLLRHVRIEGAGAAEIVGSVRSLVARGVLEDGSLLPPVRVLADQLGLNRNTVAAAYRQLAERGVVEGRGRGGTVVASPERLRGEGSPSAVPAVDLAGGNPDPAVAPGPAGGVRRGRLRPAAVRRS